MNLEFALSTLLDVLNHKGECNANDLLARGCTPEQIAFCQEIADSIEALEQTERPRYLM